MKLPFGKYKGQEISTTPTSYLQWLFENNQRTLDKGLEKEIEDELTNRAKPTTGKTTKYALYVFGEKLYELVQHIPDNYPFEKIVRVGEFLVTIERRTE